MISKMATILKCALVLQIICMACVLSHSQLVTTTQGRIQGFMTDAYGKEVTVFMGIPYAKPPLATLRFKPPEAAGRWSATGTLKATTAKPACPQNIIAVSKSLGANFKITETNEDCLYLNVYVPNTPEMAKSSPLAVMVFIHGGGFQMESGTLWDGSILAAHANVIVISMNFRLGVLGFLSTEDSAAPGNWGLLDQRLALQWVQKNINAFGGDKSKVTIFGHGSGAYSVGLHILSPLSRGLFARAISQAGAIASPALLNPNPRMRVRPLAMMTKCLATPDDDFPSDEIVECLRKVDVSDLLSHDAATEGAFTPTVDKRFLPDDPVAMLESANFSAVDYIIGGHSDEAANIAYKIPDFYTGPGINSSTFEKYIADVSSLALPKPIPETVFPALAAVISAKYYPTGVTMGEFRRSYLDALGDVMISKIFMTGHWYALRGKVFVFHFTHKPSESRFPDYVGPDDAEEMHFIFGYTLRNGTEDEKRLSRDWMNAWGTFARTGNPNFNNGSLVWSHMKRPEMNYLEITVNMTEQNVKSRWKTDIRRFWNNALPQVASLAAYAMDMPPNCENTMLGLTAAEADAAFIVLIILSFFLLVITGGLTFMLYKANAQQYILAKKALLKYEGLHNAVVDDEIQIDKETPECHTKM